jgi:hypothetical protein
VHFRSRRTEVDAAAAAVVEVDVTSDDEFEHAARAKARAGTPANRVRRGHRPIVERGSLVHRPERY